MSDRLLELLSQNAGMGDEVAALQAQLLRAKGLRTQAQTDPRRTTAKGGMFSALARGVNAYRAGTMEADTETAQAGIDARRAEIMQNLPAIGGPGGAEVAFAQDPQAAALAAQQRADQNDQLGSALARTGDPRLTAAAAPYTADAKEQTGNVLKSAIARMGDTTKRETNKAHTGSYTPETGGYMLDQVSGRYILLPADPAALEAKLERTKAGAAGRAPPIIYGPGGEAYVYDSRKPDVAPTPVPAPKRAQPPGAAPVQQPTQGEVFTKGAPADVQKMTEDLKFLSAMPQDLGTLKKYAGKDVPGKGPLDGLTPNFAASKAAIEVRQAAGRMLNALLYMTSGKTITDAELGRHLQARGLGDYATSAQYAAGVAQLEAELKTATRNFVASRPPGVIRLAKERGVLKGLEGMLGEAPAQERKVVRTGTRNGKKVVQYDDGTIEETP